MSFLSTIKIFVEDLIGVLVWVIHTRGPRFGIVVDKGIARVPARTYYNNNNNKSYIHSVFKISILWDNSASSSYQKRREVP